MKASPLDRLEAEIRATRARMSGTLARLDRHYAVRAVLAQGLRTAGPSGGAAWLVPIAGLAALGVARLGRSPRLPPILVEAIDRAPALLAVLRRHLSAGLPR